MGSPCDEAEESEKADQLSHPTATRLPCEEGPPAQEAVNEEN